MGGGRSRQIDLAAESKKTFEINSDQFAALREKGRRPMAFLAPTLSRHHLLWRQLR
jgi:hypothetical protein